MSTNCKFPCFDLELESEGAIECLLKGDKGECRHLSEGGTWETCSKGKLYSEYQDISKPPDREGYYLIWEGSPGKGQLMGVVRRRDDLNYWVMNGSCIGAIVWGEGYQWSRVEV